MYAIATTQADAKAHFCHLATKEVLTDPAHPVKKRIRSLTEDNVITCAECADALKALDRWMKERPESEEPVQYAEQFFDEFEGSAYAYLPGQQ